MMLLLLAVPWQEPWAGLDRYGYVIAVSDEAIVYLWCVWWCKSPAKAVLDCFQHVMTMMPTGVVLFHGSVVLVTPTPFPW
jgi:hypothetical protein